MPQFRDRETDSERHEARYRNWESLNSEDDAYNPYVDLIQRDPVVCDTCFLFRYDVLSCDWWRGSFGWSKYSKWTPIHGRSEDVPAGTAARGTKLVCKNCGTDTGEQERPIPKAFIDEYAENLSTTLDAKGIDHDDQLLLDEIERRNEKSENQCRQDAAVFAPAVQRAIRTHQYTSSNASTHSASD